MSWADIIFWICFGALVHTYILYPGILNLLYAFRARRKKNDAQNQALIKLSVLIPAYNEEKVIRQKLESVFQSDYPPDHLEVIVGSDASTDKTNHIVGEFPRVKLVVFEGRSGKPKIMNQLAAMASNPILILTDANVLFDRQTLKELVRPFADPKVGLVDSRMQHSGSGNQAESAYIRGEARTKFLEGELFGAMIGPFGGCFAVRKSAFQPVPENFLVDDFYINMKVLQQGFHALSTGKAIVFEEVPADLGVEFRRKIRIATGSYQNLFAFLNMILPVNAIGFCFISHKVMRWKGPFYILACLIIAGWYVFSALGSLYGLPELPDTIALGTDISLYAAFLALFIIGLALLVLDFLLTAMRISTPLRMLTHFATTNIALMIGFIRFLKGVRSGIWTPTKR